MNILASRIAAAGILRLALRWPAVSVILILSIVAARLISGRRPQEGPMDQSPLGEWKPRR